MVTPVHRREAMVKLVNRGLSKSAAIKMLGWSRAVACYALKQPMKDAELGNRITEVSQRFPRFGYRRIAAWTDIGSKRVWRLWSLLGLSLPKRRPRRRRCGSDIRLPNAMLPNAVWTYDFVHDRTAEGRGLKLLCVLDEYTRE